MDKAKRARENGKITDSELSSVSDISDAEFPETKVTQKTEAPETSLEATREEAPVSEEGSEKKRGPRKKRETAKLEGPTPGHAFWLHDDRFVPEAPKKKSVKHERLSKKASFIDSDRWTHDRFMDLHRNEDSSRRAAEPVVVTKEPAKPNVKEFKSAAQSSRNGPKEEKATKRYLGGRKKDQGSQQQPADLASMEKLSLEEMDTAVEGDSVPLHSEKKSAKVERKDSKVDDSQKQSELPPRQPPKIVRKPVKPTALKEVVNAPAFKPKSEPLAKQQSKKEVASAVPPAAAPPYPPQNYSSVQPMVTSSGQFVYMTETGLMIPADPNYMYILFPSHLRFNYGYYPPPPHPGASTETFYTPNVYYPPPAGSTAPPATGYVPMVIGPPQAKPVTIKKPQDKQ